MQVCKHEFDAGVKSSVCTNWDLNNNDVGRTSEKLVGTYRLAVNSSLHEDQQHRGKCEIQHDRAVQVHHLKLNTIII